MLLFKDQYNRSIDKYYTQYSVSDQRGMRRAVALHLRDNEGITMRKSIIRQLLINLCSDKVRNDKNANRKKERDLVARRGKMGMPVTSNTGRPAGKTAPSAPSPGTAARSTTKELFGTDDSGEESDSGEGSDLSDDDEETADEVAEPAVAEEDPKIGSNMEDGDVVEEEAGKLDEKEALPRK